MKQYIDKAAVVAEIERLKSEALQKKDQCKSKGLSKIIHQIGAYNKVLSFLNTLEVKEVDCEKVIEGLTVGWIEGEEYGKLQNVNANRCVTLDEVKEAMRCTYELGLKAQKGE